jgi:hypothetical protein
MKNGKARAPRLTWKVAFRWGFSRSPGSVFLDLSQDGTFGRQNRNGMPWEPSADLNRTFGVRYRTDWVACWTNRVSQRRHWIGTSVALRNANVALARWKLCMELLSRSGQ